MLTVMLYGSLCNILVSETYEAIKLVFMENLYIFLLVLIGFVY